MPKFKKSYELKKMQNQWKTVRDCYCGNKKIKGLDKQKYLPRFAVEKVINEQYVITGESESSYNSRLENAVYDNFIKPAIDEISQAPFKKRIAYKENFNKDYKKMLEEDCDLKRTSFQDYLENSLRSSLIYGVHASFVDYSEQRPFFESIEATQILGAWQDYVDGRFVLSRFIFFKDFVRQVEVNRENEAYEEFVYRRVIDLVYPNTLRVYETQINKEESSSVSSYAGELNYSFNNNDEFKLIQEITLDTEELPICFLFSDKRIGTITCEVPFYDNSLSNIQHYRKSSNRDAIVLVSGFPMIKATGVSGQDLKNFDGSTSPHKAFVFQDSKADVSYIEPDGKSIAQIREDLKELQAKITLSNYEWISGKRSEVTATSEIIDENNKNTKTKNLALYVNEYANKLLKIFGQYEKISDKELEDFTIEINTDIEFLQSQNKVTALSDAYKSGAISVEAYTKRLMELGVLTDDFDIEEDKAKVEEAFNIFQANNEDEQNSQEENNNPSEN